MPAKFRLDPNLDAWERQPGESDPAWQAFVHFRDSALEDGARRSSRRTATALDKSRQLIGLWSATNEWMTRVAAYDRKRDAERLAESAAQIKRAVRRHGLHLESIAMALIQPIDAYLHKIAELGGPSKAFSDMSFKELQSHALTAAKMMPAVVQAERLVHGLATERGEVKVTDERAAARERFKDSGREELEVFLAGAAAGAAAERDAEGARRGSETD